MLSIYCIETVLLKVANDLRISIDSNNVVVFILLDLSATFEAIYHGILINRVEKWVGLSLVALDYSIFHIHVPSGKHLLSL